MSDPNDRAALSSSLTPLGRGCLTAFMVIVGIILLLPGLCAAFVGTLELVNKRFDPGLNPLVAIGLLIGFGGVSLIVWAILRIIWAMPRKR
jgi:hypothetical protein